MKRGGRRVEVALTRESIIDVAETLARRDGLDAVTVRKVSTELGVTPAAMYWHLADKQKLVRALVDRASGRTEQPGPEFGNWVDRLLRFYLSTREQFTAYTGLSAALVTAEPTDATLANCLFAIEVLMEGGFSESEALSVFDTLSTISWGHLMMIDVGRSNQQQDRPDAIAAYAGHVRDAIEPKPEYAVLVRDFDDDVSRGQLVRAIELVIRASARDAGFTVPISTTVASAT